MLKKEREKSEKEKQAVWFRCSRKGPYQSYRAKKEKDGNPLPPLEKPPSNPKGSKGRQAADGKTGGKSKKSGKGYIHEFVSYASHPDSEVSPSHAERPSESSLTPSTAARAAAPLS